MPTGAPETGRTRVEHDLLGDVPVPASVYYGADRARSRTGVMELVLDRDLLTPAQLDHPLAHPALTDALPAAN